MSTARSLLTIGIPVEPVPKGRPRVAVNGSGKAHAYSPKSVEQFENAVRWELKAARVRPIQSGHLVVDATFYIRSLDGNRGDIDNYVKSLFDACNTFVWADDKQVTEVHARLREADGFKPFITMSVAMDDLSGEGSGHAA